MNRSRAKAGRYRATLCAAASLALLLTAFAPVRAADLSSPNFWFAGTKLIFERPQFHGTSLAVASDDNALGRFLSKLGATLSFQPGQNYIVISTGDRRAVTFTLGDARYIAGGAMQTAAFAPYSSGGVVYLPFLDLARALYIAPVDDAGTTVLQPQIAALDVRSEGRTTVVTLRGASPLHFKRQSEGGDERVSLTFSGIASTLERQRQIGGAGLHGIAISVGGTARNPATTVTFDAPAGGVHALAPADSPNSFAIAFAPAGIALGGSPLPAQGDPWLASAPLASRDTRDTRDSRTAAPPPPPPPGQTQSTPGAIVAQTPVPAPAGIVPAPPAGAPQAAIVTAFDTVPTDAGLDVRLQLSGAVGYQWHRLGDNRWYVDLKPATLAVPSQDETLQNDAVLSLRLKAFVGPTDRLPTVRVALTLPAPHVVNLVATGSGLTVAVERLDDLDPQRAGVGSIDGGRIVAAAPSSQPVMGVTGDPNDPSAENTPAPAPTWKFAPLAPGTNAKLIVIDPGHGGSDAGAMHNGLVEKDLTLDISRRLRTLLVARGWQVRMTRDSDVDVFGPNDSAHDELQARDDVANGSGARMLISIHCNAFTTSVLSGTTTYYYKPDSYALAAALHARLASSLGIKDDGIRKENFYVIHHATMPAVLVETAFISNPGDAALMHTSAFLTKIASSVADGVGDYASSSQPLTSTSSGTDGL